MRTAGKQARPVEMRLEGVGDTLQDRVRRAIARDIESGVYAPGDRLPAEKDLAAELGVSLAPVRGALDQLAQRGVVARRQGKGTFVEEQRVPYRLESWRSCTGDLRAQGIAFDAHVLEAGPAATPPEVATALGLDVGVEAFHLVRLIDVQGRPGILLDSWTRDFTPADEDEYFATGGSLYRALTAQGIRIVSVETAIEVSFADEREAALFELSYGAALLQVTGVSSDQHGPREWSRLKYNAATFSLNMRREVGQTG